MNSSEYCSLFTIHDFKGSTIGNTYCLLKDVGFEEEQECRLALTVTNDLSMQKQMNDKLKLSFRAKSSALVPYYALDVNAEDSIKEIVIGPKNSSRDKDIKEFVSQFYSPNITIRRSAISYR